MELFPLMFATGWASGLDVDAMLLLLGLLALHRTRTGWQAVSRRVARDAAPVSA